MNISRDKILTRISKALQTTTPLPYPEAESKNASVFHPADDDLALIFAREFTALGGKFAYCPNPLSLETGIKDLCSPQLYGKAYASDDQAKKLLNHIGVTPWQSLYDCDVSVTFCEATVARTGSVLLSSALAEGRTASVYAPVHIIVALTNTLVYDIEDAFKLLKHKYPEQLPSFITFATGPSRTADIEKTLVTGVHGPKEVYCFLFENDLRQT